MLQKKLIISKNNSTKIAQNEISNKKLTGSISLSTSAVELGSAKDVLYLKYYNTLE